MITGSGVAYPWKVLQQVPHPESHIVEDMHYSIDLALCGYAPTPCMEAIVESQLPAARDAAHTQRTRWEHGHLSVILDQGPRLMAGAIRQRSPLLLAMWLELIVPPLSLLLVLLAGASAIALAVGIFASLWLPLFLLLTGIGVALLGLSGAWWRFGRRALPPQMLARVPRYILGKLSIYTQFLSAPEQSWVRTARDASSSNSQRLPAGPHFDVPRSPAEKTTSAE